MEILAACPRVSLVATDAKADLLEAYRESAPDDAAAVGLLVLSPDPSHLRLEARGFNSRCIEVRFRTASVPDAPAGRFDLLLAQSFWDLLPPGAALGFARQVISPSGLFLSTLTFAGETRFEPRHEFDGPILASYHGSMGGDRGGDPSAGDRLPGEFGAAESGFRVLAEGPSDWNVLPSDGGYPKDERFFLETILGFVAKETAADPDVPAEVRGAWLAARRRQLRDGRLAYSARQRDLLAERIRRPSRSGSR